MSGYTKLGVTTILKLRATVAMAVAGYKTIYNLNSININQSCICFDNSL